VPLGRASLTCLTAVAVLLAQGSHRVAAVQDLATQTQEPIANTQAPGPPAPLAEDGTSYLISALRLQYIKDSRWLPSFDDVMQIEVELGQTPDGYVAPREGVPRLQLRLADVGQRPVERYYASALQRILERIRDFYLEKERIVGVYVAPDPRQIDETGTDLRPADQTDLRILITTGIVTELRSLASGERIAPEERINNPLHEGIRAGSPIQPARGGEEYHLLRKDLLDRYLFHLGRHPGRRVDASVSAAEEPGGVALDYLITENKPWVLYFQLSNTGTGSTERLRERFGLLHNQLTNNDDILELTFITANFGETNAVQGYYEAPFAGNDRVRWRAHGRWSEFTAADVGAFLDTFTGGDWIVGGEIIANIYQDRELFVDLLAGARYLNTDVDSPFVGQGEESFFLPHVGVRFERRTEWMNTAGFLDLEFHTETLGDVDRDELARLGRTLPDEEWAVMRWNLRHSVYLEPLLNREAWEDPATPETSTLAHELAISFRGQYAFDNRLIPNLERPLGGLFTVRGYPESVVAGDTAILGSIEYRYHVPRAFGVRPEPDELFGEPFRLAPQHVYGRPDWDLVLKGFLDVGQSIVSDPFSFEEDNTLVGAGVGFELSYKRNLQARVDWGFVLNEIESRSVNSGSNRLQFLVTLLF
jgi:hypothetical protein